MSLLILVLEKMSKSGEFVKLVRRSMRLSLLESKENTHEEEIEIKGALETPKGRKECNKFKKYGVRINYHLRRTILEELVKFRGKELVEYEKKENTKCKYCKDYLGKKNSLVEVFDIPSGSGGDTNLKSDYYPLTLVPSKDLDEEVVTVRPVPPQTRHG